MAGHYLKAVYTFGKYLITQLLNYNLKDWLDVGGDTKHPDKLV